MGLSGPLTLLRALLKSDSKYSVFLLSRRDPVLELQLLTPLQYSESLQAAL